MAGQLRIRRRGKRLIFIESRLGPSSHLFNGYREGLPEEKVPRHEADNLPSPKFKNVWSYTSTPPYVFMVHRNI
jgi:hypothetical protein